MEFPDFHILDPKMNMISHMFFDFLEFDWIPKISNHYFCLFYISTFSLNSIGDHNGRELDHQGWVGSPETCY